MKPSLGPDWNETTLSRFQKLRERDGDVCHICHEPIRFEGLRGHTTYDWPTLDHIVPRCQGGRSTMENLAIAHLLCNAVRGDDDGKTWGRQAQRRGFGKWASPIGQALIRRYMDECDGRATDHDGLRESREGPHRDGATTTQA